MTTVWVCEPGPGGKQYSPWTLLLVAGGLVLFLDLQVFQSQLYQNVLQPVSYAGRFQLLVERERQRGNSGLPEILLLGDSRCAEGFSERQSRDLAVVGGPQIYNGALNGSTPRVWYYLMRELLREQKKYAAVVVALDSFRDWDYGGDPATRRTDLRSLTPALRHTDIREFSLSYPSWRERISVGLSLLFKGHAYRDDFWDFLSSPGRRLEQVEAHRQHFSRWRFNYPGRLGEMKGLEFDPETRSFRFPAALTPARKIQAQGQLRRSFAAQTGLAHRYRSEWLGKLVNLLRAHSIRVIFIRLPRHPAFPLPEGHRAAPSAVLELVKAPGVAMLAEDAFADLDRQEYFFDSLHLNRKGRGLFTRSLMDALRNAL